MAELILGAVRSYEEAASTIFSALKIGATLSTAVQANILQLTAPCAATLGKLTSDLERSGVIADIDAPSASFAGTSGLPSLVLLQSARSCIKFIRNVCALGTAGQLSVIEAASLQALVRYLEYDSKAGEGGDTWNEALDSTRRFAWQCLANSIAGGFSPGCELLWSLLWRTCSPGRERAPPIVVAGLESARRDPQVAGIVASTLYSLCRDDSGQPAAARGRLGQLARDKGVYPRLLSFVTSHGSDAHESHSQPSGPGLEWQLLLTGLLARAGELQAAFGTAGSGTPLALLAGGPVPASLDADLTSAPVATGSAVSLTREQLGLLSLLEAYVETESKEECGTGGGDGDGQSSTNGEGTPSQGHLFADGDLSFFATTLRGLCATALDMARSLAGPARTDVLPNATTGDHMTTARAALALRPLLTGVCMLCDVLSDVISLKSEESSAVRGSLDGVALQRLLCGLPASHDSADATDALPDVLNSPVSVVLDLLFSVTPPPKVRDDKAGSLPPPQMVDYNEEDGSVTPVDPFAPPLGTSANAAVTGGSGADGAAGTMRQPPPRLPASTVPGGTRSSLTRLVALSCAQFPPAAEAVLGRNSSETQGSPAAGTVGGDHAEGNAPPPTPLDEAACAPPASHGLFTLLNQCVMEAGNPLLREWGLLAVRNLCEASPDVVSAIASTKAHHAGSAPELAALGVKG